MNRTQKILEETFIHKRLLFWLLLNACNLSVTLGPKTVYKCALTQWLELWALSADLVAVTLEVHTIVERKFYTFSFFLSVPSPLPPSLSSFLHFFLYLCLYIYIYIHAYIICVHECTCMWIICLFFSIWGIVYNAIIYILYRNNNNKVLTYWVVLLVYTQHCCKVNMY